MNICTESKSNENGIHFINWYDWKSNNCYCVILRTTVCVFDGILLYYIFEDHFYYAMDMYRTFMDYILLDFIQHTCTPSLSKRLDIS